MDYGYQGGKTPLKGCRTDETLEKHSIEQKKTKKATLKSQSKKAEGIHTCQQLAQTLLNLSTQHPPPLHKAPCLQHALVPLHFSFTLLCKPLHLSLLEPPLLLWEDVQTEPVMEHPAEELLDANYPHAGLLQGGREGEQP